MAQRLLDWSKFIPKLPSGFIWRPKFEREKLTWRLGDHTTLGNEIKWHTKGVVLVANTPFNNQIHVGDEILDEAAQDKFYCYRITQIVFCEWGTLSIQVERIENGKSGT